MRAKKVEKDEGMDSLTGLGYVFPKLNYGQQEAVSTATASSNQDDWLFLKTDKPKRRNGRISWKARALQAEKEAQFFYWGGLVLVVVSFFIGVNVGLYAF